MNTSTTECGSEDGRDTSRRIFPRSEFDKAREISGIGAGFLQDARSWIWMPVYAEFEVSTDGVNYTKVCRIDNTVADTDQNTQIKNFEQAINPVKAKYIRVFAKNYGKYRHGILARDTTRIYL